MKEGFPSSSADKESSCSEEDLGSISGLGRFPGEEKGYPLQCSSLENSTDCIIHTVAKSQTRLTLSNFHFHFSVYSEWSDKDLGEWMSLAMRTRFRSQKHEGIWHIWKHFNWRILES